MDLRSGFSKYRKEVHRLQWQLTFSIISASLLLSVAILGIRIVNAIKTYSTIKSSTLVAGEAHQISSVKWFRDLTLSEIRKISEQGADPEADAHGVPPAAPIALDFGSLFRDMKIDFRYLKSTDMRVFYIDHEGTAYPLSNPGESGEKAKPDQDVIIQKGVELTRRAEHQHLIMTEENKSMAVIPHKDPETGADGYYYIYMSDPDLSTIVRAMLKTSLREMFGILLIVVLLGMLIGFIFSCRWVRWFDRIKSVLNSWAEGKFSEKIAVSDTGGVTEWEELGDQLNAMSRQLEKVIETQNDLAASEERNKLARELHDSIKQQVFAINMNLGAAKALQGKDPEKASERIRLASEMTRDTLLELDYMIGTMRPLDLNDSDMLDDLEKMLENFKSSSGIKILTDVSDVTKISDQDTAAAIYRIIQEGVSNIIRHSEAEKAEVKLDVNEVGIDLLIKDNGKGFDLSEKTKKGVGLNSMRERAEALNGTFVVQSNENGTILKVHIPRKMVV